MEYRWWLTQPHCRLVMRHETATDVGSAAACTTAVTSSRRGEWMQREGRRLIETASDSQLLALVRLFASETVTVGTAVQ